MKNYKTTGAAILLAAFIPLTLLTSCSNTTSDNKVIAHVETTEDKKKSFEITYKEFNAEYLFNLRNQGFDAENDENAEEKNDMKRQVIEYLAGERVRLQAAEDLGVGLSSLTAEEQEAIITEADGLLATFAENFQEDAISELGENASESDLTAKKTELAEKYFTDVGLDKDTVYIWQRNYFIEQRLSEFLVAEVTVNTDEMNEVLNMYTENAKESYKNEPEYYNVDYSSQYFYMPENSRKSRIIQIAFTEEQLVQIANLRNINDMAGADNLRETFAEEIKERAEEAYANLETDSFENVMVYFSDDEYGLTYFLDGYILNPESVSLSFDFEVGKDFINEIYALEKTGDYTALALTDYGYFIAEYSSEAVLNLEELESIKTEIYDAMLNDAKSAVLIDKEQEWNLQYPYIFDYEALGIMETINTEPTDTESAETE